MIEEPVVRALLGALATSCEAQETYPPSRDDIVLPAGGIKGVVAYVKPISSFTKEKMIAS